MQARCTTPGRPHQIAFSNVIVRLSLKRLRRPLGASEAPLVAGRHDALPAFAATMASAILGTTEFPIILTCCALGTGVPSS